MNDEPLRLRGELVSLRPASSGDVDRLVAIRATPEVRSRWRGDDIEHDVRQALDDDELHFLVIEGESGLVVGAVQWAESEDAEYRHASVDMFLHPDVHNRGFGTDAVRVLCRHLFEIERHHRVTIDPAADNAAAIRCYEKVGFQRVGIMREYERSDDGTFHDGLLLDLLASDLI